ncbi:MAG TPA: methyltransferase domain-containing protein [Candidatus Babeliaceae bacterium]|nr:methyltransferase domain-containing protein [Candidatus Babeliaceae bacterium]
MKTLWYIMIFSVLPNINKCSNLDQLGDESRNDIKKYIQELYQNITGFGIDATESAAISNQGGAPTYGEITYEGAQELFKNLDLTKEDIFYDLGCGVGKLVVQAYFTPIKKAVGIELSPTRYQHAQAVKQKVVQKPIDGKVLEFHKQDIAQYPLDDATIIFMCSTCFSDDLMKKLSDNIRKLKDGTKIITLKRLPDHKDFVLIKQYTLPMTWSSSTPVYQYELKHKH